MPWVAFLSTHCVAASPDDGCRPVASRCSAGDRSRGWKPSLLSLCSNASEAYQTWSYDSGTRQMSTTRHLGFRFVASGIPDKGLCKSL
eukprot:gene10065-biopygen6167